MPIIMLPSAGEPDLPRIAALLRAAPPTTRHLVDMPWRLGAPALQSADDARLWQNEAGELLAFAAWQVPWVVLDCVIRSGPELAAVEDALFTWAAERFNELDRQRGHPLPYWIEARDDDIERLAAIARHGYSLDDDVGYVHLRRSLASPIPPAAPPPGFTIRPLTPASEVDAYVALHRAAFASTAMTADWRARTLRMPQYVPRSISWQSPPMARSPRSASAGWTPPGGLVRSSR
ncbi:MAG TPA: hypothetical protein VGN32_08185 [Ktedonobacterales bacterium]|nr:hypothetical protein [Ktedonobacterales bacterium]